MQAHTLVGEREPFDTLNGVIAKLLTKWGYQLGPEKSGGYVLGDKSRAHLCFQYVDRQGTEVLLFDYQKVNGKYEGRLQVSLPPEQVRELERRAAALLSAISPGYSPSNN